MCIRDSEDGRAGEATHADAPPTLSGDDLAENEAVTGLRRTHSKPKLGGYSESRTRCKKPTTAAYMDRGTARGGAAKRNAIAMGPAAIEWTVGGKYEWRDAGMRETTGKRRRLWSEGW